ncbi:hypothetical protein [Mesorhizobium sp. AA23]|nr:hypothetical protein [Mesorhizobium sp. AA23]
MCQDTLKSARQPMKIVVLGSAGDSVDDREADADSNAGEELAGSI